MTDLPEDVVDEAERLTRLARRADDPDEAAAYEADRDQRLADYGFVARVRESDDTLICHPAEWVEAGTVQFDRVEDTDRAAEVTLSGPGSAPWAEVKERNDAVVEAVRAAADEAAAAHAANARALAEFAGNHYAKPVDDLTQGELAEFRSEYYPRNAWPSDRQRALLSASLSLVEQVVDSPWPA
ncbi:MAG: rnhA operon protein [Haloferacaceae archaeon]